MILSLKSVLVRTWWLARSVSLLVGGLFLVVTFTPLVNWMLLPLVPRWTNADHGILVLLSAATTTYESPARSILIGQNTYWRTVHAIAIWRSGHFSKIVVCGLGTEQTVKPLLLAAGVPPEAILIENRSQTTRENAEFAKPLLAGLEGPYVLLTSDYHMYRASRCFQSEGIKVETIPAPDISKRAIHVGERWDCFRNLTNELIAIVGYQARGWI
jgi:uncharacterized SAM-binding protein YcdF (DUF218 family)